MNEIILNIIKLNTNLFGNNPIIKKINIGFTNTLYDVNNKYIVKICTDINNEKAFKNEINFYNLNKNNDLIPRLYLSSINKKDIPNFYERMAIYDIVYYLELLIEYPKISELKNDVLDAVKLILSNK